MDLGKIGELLITSLITLLAGGGIYYLLEWKPRQREAKAKADQAEQTTEKIKAEAQEIAAKAEATLSDKWRQMLEEQRDFFTRQVEAQTKIVKALEAEMKEQRCRIEKLEAALHRAYKRIEYLMVIIRQLIEQIKKLGQEPCVTPDEWNPEEG